MLGSDTSQGNKSISKLPKKKKKQKYHEENNKIISNICKKVKDLDVKSKTQNSDWKLQEKQLISSTNSLMYDKTFQTTGASRSGLSLSQ